MERISRFRAVLFLALFAFILVLFAGRLFVLQIVDTKGDTDNAQVYSTVTTVRAARGDILDRNMNILAGSADVENVYLDPQELKQSRQDIAALSRYWGRFWKRILPG
jgi:cell division protein FtsI/penicillin-binding protein 2